MADKTKRLPDNVAGRFYVDAQCIDCDLCRETAPPNFTRNDASGFSFVFKQPSSPQEEHACQAALAGCPVDAIGKDGVPGETETYAVAPRKD